MRRSAATFVTTDQICASGPLIVPTLSCLPSACANVVVNERAAALATVSRFLMMIRRCMHFPISGWIDRRASSHAAAVL